MAVSQSPTRLASRVIPSVDPWMAGEMFVAQHLEERRRGLAILIGSEAARRSPLTPHLLATRLDEPDLGLRAQIVQALADYFEVRGREFRYPPEVRAAVLGHLRKCDRPQVVALLEVDLAAGRKQVRLRPHAVPHLLERIPNASAQLSKIAGERGTSREVRGAAIDLIGRIGFTDALPALEGLETRLAGRVAGQIAMAFAPAADPDDRALLPLLRDTLDLLRDNE